MVFKYTEEEKEKIKAQYEQEPLKSNPLKNLILRTADKLGNNKYAIYFLLVMQGEDFQQGCQIASTRLPITINHAETYTRKFLRDEKIFNDLTPAERELLEARGYYEHKGSLYSLSHSERYKQKVKFILDYEKYTPPIDRQTFRTLMGSFHEKRGANAISNGSVVFIFLSLQRNKSEKYDQAKEALSQIFTEKHLTNQPHFKKTINLAIDEIRGFITVQEKEVRNLADLSYRLNQPVTDTASDEAGSGDDSSKPAAEAEVETDALAQGAGGETEDMDNDVAGSQVGVSDLPADTPESPASSPPSPSPADFPASLRPAPANEKRIQQD